MTRILLGGARSGYDEFGNLIIVLGRYRSAIAIIEAGSRRCVADARVRARRGPHCTAVIPPTT